MQVELILLTILQLITISCIGFLIYYFKEKIQKNKILSKLERLEQELFVTEDEDREYTEEELKAIEEAQQQQLEAMKAIVREAILESLRSDQGQQVVIDVTTQVLQAAFEEVTKSMGQQGGQLPSSLENMAPFPMLDFSAFQDKDGNVDLGKVLLVFLLQRFGGTPGSSSGNFQSGSLASGGRGGW